MTDQTGSQPTEAPPPAELARRLAEREQQRRELHRTATERLLAKAS